MSILSQLHHLAGGDARHAANKAQARDKIIPFECFYATCLTAAPQFASTSLNHNKPTKVLILIVLARRKNCLTFHPSLTRMTHMQSRGTPYIIECRTLSGLMSERLSHPSPPSTSMRHMLISGWYTAETHATRFG